MGDSGQIADELMAGVPDEWISCDSVASCVADGTFTLEEALEAYGVSPETYKAYCAEEMKEGETGRDKNDTAE